MPDSPPAAVLSVIVPVYNGAHVLPKTVPAMLAQAEPAEWVFVDDGSTDDTARVLTRLLDDGPTAMGATVRLLRHEGNRGRAQARNTGLDAASGAVLCFLDADVAPQPGYLTALKGAFEDPEVVAAVGRLTYAAEAPSEPYQRYLRSRRRGPRGSDPRAPVPWRYFLLGIGAARAEAVRAAGPFDPTLSYGEDLEYASRLARRYPDGLRYVAGAVGELHDLGRLDTALAKMREFGSANLPALVDRYPEVASQVGIDVLDGQAGLKGTAVRVLLQPALARTVRRLLPVLPPPVSDYAVRYLLGAALADSYRRGRLEEAAR